MRSARLVLPILALTAACNAPLRSPVPAMRPDVPEGSGLVFVYADAGAATERAWSAVGVENDRGAIAPLRLEPPGFAAAPSARRLLASGPVPAGHQAALVLTRAVKGAQPEDIRLPLGFSVPKRSGAVIALSSGTGAAFEAKVVPRSVTGATGLAACPAGGFVAMFDKRSGQVFGVLPTGRGPAAIALDLDRRRAYVALSEDDAIEVIDLDQGAIQERRALRAGDAPADLALLPDGRTLLVAARGASSVVFVDAQSLAEIERVEVPQAPVSLAVDRAGVRAWVVSREANAITAIDLPSRRAGRSAAVDAEPVRVQLDASQSTLWVLHEGSPYLDGVDARSLETKTRLNLGAGGTAFRLEPRTGRLLVARRDGGGIDVYDPFSQLPIDSIPSKGRVAFLAVDAETNAVYASLPDASSVGAFGLVGRAPLWSAGVGDAPGFLAVAGSR